MGKQLRWRDVYFTFSHIDVPSCFDGLRIFSIHEIINKMWNTYGGERDFVLETKKL